MTHLQRTPAPTARNSNAGSPIVSTRTNACGTRNVSIHRSNYIVTSISLCSLVDESGDHKVMKSICNELKVAFKPRHKFTAELGGYADKEDSESK
jgi:hypothetical protein